MEQIYSVTTRTKVFEGALAVHNMSEKRKFHMLSIGLQKVCSVTRFGIKSILMYIITSFAEHMSRLRRGMGRGLGQCHVRRPLG